MVDTVENGRTVHWQHIASESADIMTDTIAGVEIPDTTAVAEATDLLRERTNPLICHHSRRVFLFGSLNARKFLLDPGFSEDPAELVWRVIALHTTPGFPAGWNPRSPSRTTAG
ncbi:hypothetical protein AB0D42_35280 [Streptomyces sp. NPDC048304]|uniref:hypothetical protein n=1 Tax=Streptomyces sp. NPDC048304 TaxID=3154820 RepID=UPI0033CB554D